MVGSEMCRNYSKKKILCFVFLIACSSVVKAYNINPLNRGITVKTDGLGFLNMVTEPVHEFITRRAREIYWDRCKKGGLNNAICPQNPKHPSVIHDSLIRGIWWSDDPNQNLYKGLQLVWVGNMQDAARRAKDKKYTIDGKYKMHYRSHYGDMQFMHAMASKDGEQAEDTRLKILMWAEYLYEISIGNLREDTLFKDVPVNGLDNYFKRQADWKLSWLMQPRYLLRHFNNDFADHALGALLHMIQDSFSDSHVERVYTSTEKCSAGFVKRFNSYARQSSYSHGEADTFHAYDTNNFPVHFGPIEVSANLIWLSRNKSDWNLIVRPYLEGTVFCFDGQQVVSGPGIYRR